MVRGDAQGKHQAGKDTGKDANKDSGKSRLIISKKISKKQKRGKKTQQSQSPADTTQGDANSELEAWLSTLDSTQITHEEFKKLVKEKCNALAKKNKVEPSYFFQSYLLEKCCEVCHRFNDDEHLLLCDYCDDAYHTYCLVTACAPPAHRKHTPQVHDTRTRCTNTPRRCPIRRRQISSANQRQSQRARARAFSHPALSSGASNRNNYFRQLRKSPALTEIPGEEEEWQCPECAKQQLKSKQQEQATQQKR